MGYITLGKVLEVLYQKPLKDLAKEMVFEPLGITSAAWETCPMGIEKGGWGLSLNLEDAAKGPVRLQDLLDLLGSASWVRGAGLCVSVVTLGERHGVVCECGHAG